ncbi:unnamed protein product [Rhizophagus irregularis]|nr:unnamed protein product [Rhizophagus irregularis]CAB5388061.1 unnamed protein product [Rhizophagus irregularis]
MGLLNLVSWKLYIRKKKIFSDWWMMGYDYMNSISLPVEYSVILSPNDSSIIASEIHLASIGSSGSLAKLIILGIYIYSIWRILIHRIQ